MQTKLGIFCEKLIEAGWLAALILVPVFFNIYSARSFEPDKITLVRSIALVMLLAWLVKLAETGVGGATGNGDPKTADEAHRTGIRRLLDIPLFVPTLLLALVYIVSTILSISPQVALWGSYQRLQGTYTALSYIVIFALMATHLRTRAQVDRLVTAVILASLPVGLYGIVQSCGLDPLPWAGDVTKRVAANLGNAIFVASYLVMIVPLTVSRLIESMSAIITKEEASWGHTALSAVYIFVLAVQLLTILFSQSRGPMLGLLAGFGFMGLLILMILRHRYQDQNRLSLVETANGVVLAVALIAVSAVGGGLGYLIGRVLENASGGFCSQVGALPVLGAASGAVIGFVGLYTILAVARRGWRWMWFSWPVLAVIVALFVIAFNVMNFPGSPVEPLYRLPYLSRLGQITQTESGTGRVRVLIWQGVLELMTPHEPLGIPGEFSDSLNVIRPLIGYGPESMFNSFARVYPPELANVERRGSSADRSHNETFDALAMTGILGFVAYYFLMFSLFYYLLKAVGWIPGASARRRLLALWVVGGVAGVIIPRLLAGSFVFSGLGLPAGMLFMMFVYLVWQALIGSGDRKEQRETAAQPTGGSELLLLGIFAALVAHFVEVHFVFSIAATYVYFWAYAGVVVAQTRWSPWTPEPGRAEASVQSDDSTSASQVPERSTRKRKRRRRKPASSAVSGTVEKMATKHPGAEDWETWLGVWGLVVTIVLIALIFDFVSVQFDISRGSFSTLWMLAITWGLGLIIGLGQISARDSTWRTPINWGRALLLYGATSLGYALFFLMVHRWQLGRVRNITATDPIQGVIRGAGVYSGALILFYVFVGLLLLLIALMLAMPFFQRQPTWRAANWWLYPILIVATGVGVWFKNVDVVRADMYLKQGEQYRGQRQYDSAIALHQRSIGLDPDEDFYYLMLALDYQLKGQDGSVPPEGRAQAWEEGEKVAIQARKINRYNPDNTGNMGRYYLTWAQFTPPDDPQVLARYQKALDFFEKATHLAPQNVVYYNLLAQTYYQLGQFELAEKILQTSAALDPEFEQTPMLLGDTYAAMGRPEAAAKAHRAAILLAPDVFADQNLDQRLNFYLSASQPLTNPSPEGSSQAGTPIQVIISAFEEAQEEYPNDARIPRTLGRIYARIGDYENATARYEQAIQMGDNSVQTALDMADLHLALKDYETAANEYQRVLLLDPQNTQAHANLGYVYAQLGRLDEAIQENLQVLELNPDDYITQRNLVLLYRDSNRMEEAISQAERMIEVTPENELETAYLLLGNLYETSGDVAKADVAYQRAVAANPDSSQALTALGNLYLQSGRPEDALETFEAMAQVAPENYAVYQQLAMIYWQLKRYDEALSAANQALRLAPEDAQDSLRRLVAQIEAEKEG